MILEYSQNELRALTALTSADRERLIPRDITAITGLLNRYEEELLAASANDIPRETVAKWMHANRFATGHGDTLEDLLAELTWQVAELRSKLDTSKARIAEVKPLEWIVPVNADTMRKAETVVGIYRVWTHHEARGKWFWSWEFGNENLPSAQNMNSESEAKSAAEAHYIERAANVISALTLPPHGDAK